MIKEGKFGVQEAIALASITIGAKALYGGTRKVVEDVGPASWMVLVLALLVGLVWFSLVYLLLKRFPGKNLIEIFEIAFGRIIGSVFSLITAVFFLGMGATFLREFVEMLRAYVFPNTTSEYLILFFIACMVIQCFLGLETIARFARLLGVILFVSMIALLLFAFKEFKFTHLFPVFGHGIGKVVSTGLMRGSEYGEIISLAVFAGSLQGISHIKKSGYASIIISGYIFVSCGMAFILMYPYFTASEITSPMYTVARTIEFGRFFERLDPVFLFTWVLAALISTTVQFYTSVSIYCKVFRIQDARPTIFPLIILTFLISLVPRDFSTILTTISGSIRNYGFTIFFIPSVLALIISIIRKKKGGQNACASK